jgi:hypothetical protein
VSRPRDERVSFNGPWAPRPQPPYLAMAKTISPARRRSIAVLNTTSPARRKRRASSFGITDKHRLLVRGPHARATVID